MQKKFKCFNGPVIGEGSLKSGKPLYHFTCLAMESLEFTVAQIVSLSHGFVYILAKLSLCFLANFASMHKHTWFSSEHILHHIPAL